jgi:hypothetical protein
MTRPSLCAGIEWCQEFAALKPHVRHGLPDPSTIISGLSGSSRKVIFDTLLYC